MRAALLAAALTLGAARLRAQAFDAVVLADAARHRLLYEGVVRARSGVLLGAGAALEVRRARVQVAGLFGTLNAADDAADADQQVRGTAVGLAVRVVGGFEIGLEGETWRFEDDAGATVWRFIGPQARVTTGLGVPSLSGEATLAFFPVREATAGPELGTALRGTVDLILAAPRGPLALRVGYRFERVDRRATGDSGLRLDELRGVRLGVRARLHSR